MYTDPKRGVPGTGLEASADNHNSKVILDRFKQVLWLCSCHAHAGGVGRLIKSKCYEHPSHVEPLCEEIPRNCTL